MCLNSLHRKISHNGSIIIKLVFTALLLASMVGCSPLRVVNGLTPDGAEKVERDVPYGSESRQRLDIYWPQQLRVGSPVIVFFYGGSWRNGDRGDYQFVGQSLSSRGYITVVPDYRLYPEVRFPSFVEDGAQALVWITDNIAEAANGIIIIGHSAGAHLAALLALDQRYTRGFGLEASQIKGVIGLAGPYAFDPLSYRKTRPIFSGMANIDFAKPITFACNSNTPFLLLHGRDDNLVLPVNSIKLNEQQLACGIESRLIELYNVGHFDILLGLSDSFTHLAPVLDPIEAFIQNSEYAQIK